MIDPSQSNKCFSNTSNRSGRAVPIYMYCLWKKKIHINNKIFLFNLKTKYEENKTYDFILILFTLTLKDDYRLKNQILRCKAKIPCNSNHGYKVSASCLLPCLVTLKFHLKIKLHVVSIDQIGANKE